MTEALLWFSVSLGGQVRYFSLLITTLLVGCGYDWERGQEHFPDPYKNTPHWRDCDGDGLGDPGFESVCKDVDTTDIPDCIDGASDGARFVQNARDCDDSHAASGARIGDSCPDDFGWEFGDNPLSTTDYGVYSIGNREVLIWHDHPVDHLAASRICDRWAETDAEFPYGEKEEGVHNGIASSIVESQNVRDEVFQMMAATGRTEWLAYVGVKYDTGWKWRDGTELGAISYCDGATGIDSTEIVPIPEGLLSEPEFDALLGNMLLAARFTLSGSTQEFCLVNPSDEDYCHGGTVCSYDVICERPFIDAKNMEVFEVGNKTCAI